MRGTVALLTLLAVACGAWSLSWVPTDAGQVRQPSQKKERPEEMQLLKEQLQLLKKQLQFLEGQAKEQQERMAALKEKSEQRVAKLEKTLSAKPRYIYSKTLGMKLAFVPRGTFWMSKGGKNAQREVTIPHDFYLGAYEVTQGQWQAVMDKNPSYFSRTGRGKDRVKEFPDEELNNFPVEQVSYDDVKEFLKKLNEKEKNSGWLYRLPTEAEWEYACRGGPSSKTDCSFDFYFQEPTKDLSSLRANFDGSQPAGQAFKGPYLGQPTRAGQYNQPNKLGRHDMHGNVWEWCDDFYKAGGSRRVIRGGGWNRDGRRSTASDRDGYEPGIAFAGLGFRLLAVPSGK